MSRQDIEAREQQFLGAFNGGDAALLTSFYADGARILPPGGEAVTGTEAIEAIFNSSRPG
jgi:ketosteroid isomerase-like protein